MIAAEIHHSYVSNNNTLKSKSLICNAITSLHLHKFQSLREI